MKSKQRTILLLATALMLAAVRSPNQFQAQAGEQVFKLGPHQMAQQLTTHFFLAQAQQPTIACGETKQGSIDQSDQTLSDGRHFDDYAFTTTQPNQPFIVTAQASNFPVQSALFFFDPQQQQFVFVQESSVGAANMQVQYSGVLATPGDYALLVIADTPQSLGPYTVKFECQACGAAGGGGGCSGGTPDNPVQIQLDQQVSCELTSDDVQVKDQQGGIHFGKVFTFQAPGGSIQTTVTTQAFTPLILVLDPNSGQITNSGPSPFTANFPAGPAFIVVTSNEVQATGPFTIELTAGGGFPPF